MLSYNVRPNKCFSLNPDILTITTDDITRCKCKAQFCYLCGAKWKSCSCQRWDEQRLEERAQEVVDREANQVLRPHNRQLRVARMQQDLREVHECEHPGRFRETSRQWCLRSHDCTLGLWSDCLWLPKHASLRGWASTTGLRPGASRYNFRAILRFGPVRGRSKSTARLTGPHLSQRLNKKRIVSLLVAQGGSKCTYTG